MHYPSVRAAHDESNMVIAPRVRVTGFRGRAARVCSHRLRRAACISSVPVRPCIWFLQSALAAPAATSAESPSTPQDWFFRNATFEELPGDINRWRAATRRRRRWPGFPVFPTGCALREYTAGARSRPRYYCTAPDSWHGRNRTVKKKNCFMPVYFGGNFQTDNAKFTNAKARKHSFVFFDKFKML